MEIILAAGIGFLIGVVACYVHKVVRENIGEPWPRE
jgi:hypothetical protein